MKVASYQPADWSDIAQVVSIPSTLMMNSSCALINTVETTSKVGHISCLSITKTNFNDPKNMNQKIRVVKTTLLDVQTADMSLSRIL